jgi:hypothetical protein
MREIPALFEVATRQIGTTLGRLVLLLFLLAGMADAATFALLLMRSACRLLRRRWRHLRRAFRSCLKEIILLLASLRGGSDDHAEDDD